MLLGCRLSLQAAVFFSRPRLAGALRAVFSRGSACLCPGCLQFGRLPRVIPPCGTCVNKRRFYVCRVRAANGRAGDDSASLSLSKVLLSHDGGQVLSQTQCATQLGIAVRRVRSRYQASFGISSGFDSVLSGSDTPRERQQRQSSKTVATVDGVHHARDAANPEGQRVVLQHAAVPEGAFRVGVVQLLEPPRQEDAVRRPVCAENVSGDPLLERLQRLVQRHAVQLKLAKGTALVRIILANLGTNTPRVRSGQKRRTKIVRRVVTRSASFSAGLPLPRKLRQSLASDLDMGVREMARAISRLFQRHRSSARHACTFLRVFFLPTRSNLRGFTGFYVGPGRSEK